MKNKSPVFSDVWEAFALMILVVDWHSEPMRVLPRASTIDLLLWLFRDEDRKLGKYRFALCRINVSQHVEARYSIHLHRSFGLEKELYSLIFLVTLEGP